jgi:hypothetical protein
MSMNRIGFWCQALLTLAKLLRQHLRRVAPRLSSAAVICNKSVS